MSPFTNREIIDRYVRAAVANDLDAQDALLADDLIEDYPQSGERLRGKAKRRAMFDHYPGRAAQEFVQQADRVIGSEDRWVVTPSMTPMRIVGTGDEYVGTGQITYPSGEVWYLIQVVELRDGKISRLTSYFAAPFEAPAWRAGWVEKMPGR